MKDKTHAVQTHTKTHRQEGGQHTHTHTNKIINTHTQATILCGCLSVPFHTHTQTQKCKHTHTFTCSHAHIHPFSLWVCGCVSLSHTQTPMHSHIKRGHSGIHKSAQSQYSKAYIISSPPGGLYGADNATGPGWIYLPEP